MEHLPPDTGPSLSQSPTSRDRNNGSPLSAKFSFVVVVTACSASQMAVASLGFLDLTYEVYVEVLILSSRSSTPSRRPELVKLAVWYYCAGCTHGDVYWMEARIWPDARPRDSIK